jgi:hypothetical protein
MSRRTPPQVVEVYYPGESTKVPSKVHMSYEEADRVHAARKGIFRDRRRKIVLEVRPHVPSVLRAGSLECRKSLIEKIDYRGKGMSRGGEMQAEREGAKA